MNPMHDGFFVLNPATGELLATYPTDSDADSQAIVKHAHSSYLSWRRSEVEHRAAILGRAAELFRERTDDLANTLMREMGKPLREAHGEVMLAADVLQFYAKMGPAFLIEASISTSLDGEASVINEPIGAILGVMPWNVPYYQTMRFAAPNLVLGNSVIVKPAPQCPESAFAMRDILLEAGVEEGTFQIALSSNAQVAAMIADPHVAGVSLTGSDATGQIIAAESGRHIKRTVLELGGSDPMLVLDDADLGLTAHALRKSRFTNAGQTCVSPKRILVQDGVFDEFAALAVDLVGKVRVGDPADPETDIGPLSSRAAAERYRSQIRDALDRGAQLLAGSGDDNENSAFVAPVVIFGVRPEMRIAREEVFGPAIVLYRFGSDNEGVKLANDTPYGLGGAVFSESPERAKRIAEKLDVGMVFINSQVFTRPELPFGGTKRSGIGRELGRDGVLEFANRKLMYTIGNW